MNKIKSDYLAPVAETLIVRFEGCLCASGDNEKFGTETDYEDGLE